jgi:hypothetical protein
MLSPSISKFQIPQSHICVYCDVEDKLEFLLSYMLAVLYLYCLEDDKRLQMMISNDQNRDPLYLRVLLYDGNSLS